jgi:putative SOS response-associated peptidase YedK
MCGRQVLRANEAQLARTFPSVDFANLGLTPRYNIPPTMGVLSLVGGAKRAGFLTWGLIPSWARNADIAYETVSARCETVHTQPNFRAAFEHKRAVLFADGFLEWLPALPGQRVKQPVLFERPGREPFAMAGLWERWESPHNGEVIRSCTLITCPPNPTVGPIHDRMPVILRPDQVDAWLSSGKDLEASRALMQPFGGALTATFVSTRVNNVTDQSPDVLARVA